MRISRPAKTHQDLLSVECSVPFPSRHIHDYESVVSSAHRNGDGEGVGRCNDAWTSDHDGTLILDRSWLATPVAQSCPEKVRAQHGRCYDRRRSMS
jgi:hypothetical protein